MRNTTEKPHFLASIAVIALASPASSAPAASGAATAAKQPAAKVQDEKALVSVSSMSASDYAACVSDLKAAKVVFEQVGEAKEEGCELSGAVRLISIATPFGDVAIAGKPTMLCSFARQFSSWSREVAAPLTLAYTGQRLAEIGAGSAFSGPLRQARRDPERARQRGRDRHCFVRFGGQSPHSRQAAQIGSSARA